MYLSSYLSVLPTGFYNETREGAGTQMFKQIHCPKCEKFCLFNKFILNILVYI